MNRPRQLTIRLPQETMVSLRKDAREKERSVNWQASKIIREHYKNKQEENKNEQ